MPNGLTILLCFVMGINNNCDLEKDIFSRTNVFSSIQLRHLMTVGKHSTRSLNLVDTVYPSICLYVVSRSRPKSTMPRTDNIRPIVTN